MYFCFKNMPNLAERPDVLRHEVFKKIFDVTELLNMDSVTRSKLLEKMTTERDLRNQIRYATETAMAEGLEKGLAEGREKGKEIGLAEGREIGKEIGLAEGRAEGGRAKAIEIAVKLIANGMSKEEAAEFVGVDVADLDLTE